MIFTAINDFCNHIANNGRLLAIDVGEKWVGIAVSDPTQSIATPETVIARKPTPDCMIKTNELLNTNNAIGIIIGLPLSMDGKITPAGQSTKAFARLLHNAGVNLPILLWDERFSTVAMQKSLIKNDVSRQKRTQVIDKLAACYILQGALTAISVGRKINGQIHSDLPPS